LPILKTAGLRTGVARCLDVLGQIESVRGQYSEADAHFRETLSLRDEVLGAGHPETAEVLDHYCSLLCLMGRGDEAATMARRAAEIRRTRAMKSGQHS
jgi:hypothetical protein